MSPEFIAILSIGATLAGTQLAAVLWLAGYVRVFHPAEPDPRMDETGIV